MRNLNPELTACRHCQHYSPEGRRGGGCQLLGVSVQGNWKPCPFMIPAFNQAWPALKTLIDSADAIAQPLPAHISANLHLNEQMAECEF